MIKRFPANKRSVVLILVILIFCAGIYILGRTTVGTSHSQIELSSIPANAAASNIVVQGKTLATKHCTPCHVLPDPSLLDKENWQAALAMMAPRLGIFYHKEQSYPIFTDIDQSFYPSSPAMNSTEWQNIIDYYTAMAPAVLTPAFKKPVKRELPFFSLELPSSLFYRTGNTASYVKVDTSVKPHRLLVNRSGSNTLFLLSGNMQLIDSLVNDGPIVDIDISGKEYLSSRIGTNLFGDNSRNGALTPLKISRTGEMSYGNEPLFQNLARPVQVQSADLNGDLLRDYLVCEFGNVMGSLFWMENKGQKQYLRHEIRAFPGATKAHVEDYNKDGRPDIWVQFSQGEEGIFLFTNKGNGSFAEKQVLQVPPSYGSSSFELNDFNKDGFPDILYTCGDRGDGINQVKPYHGVYIFMNNGKNEFTQKYFYPINGCIKAMAKDFDKDGDLDIAAIGFFIDNQHPEEGFTFLKNDGDLNFDAYSLPSNANFHRATTMDVADIDSDGKQDIILGHGFIGTKATDEIKPLFIVLKNRF
ncbi:MAG: VCBS repeat-containing protein [Bacteroidota bacterium]